MAGVKIQMKVTEEHFGAGYYALEGCFVNFSLVQFRMVEYEPSSKGIREVLVTFSFATGKKKVRMALLLCCSMDSRFCGLFEDTKICQEHDFILSLFTTVLVCW